MARLQSSDSTDMTVALRRLQEGDFETRWDAAKQLVRLGPAVLPTLLSLLSMGDGSVKDGAVGDGPVDEDSDDMELHWFVARILGELRHPVAVDALLHLAQIAQPSGQPSEVATVAATSLAKSGDLALPALTELLAAQETRVLAVQALSQVGHVTAIPALLSVVTDANAEVRAVAVEALTAFRAPRVTPVLAEALNDTASAVRLAALRGIGSRGKQLLQTEALVARVGELLGDLNGEVAGQAAIALGRLKTPAALAQLEAALQHDLMPLPLKLQVIRALGWSETPAALGSLGDYLGRQLQFTEPPSAALAHSSHPLSLEIVRVLGRIQQPTLQDLATTILLESLNTLQSLDASSTDLQASIALSLGQLGCSQSFLPLVQLLSQTDSSLRFHVLAALKRLDPEGEELLRAQQQKAPAALAAGITFALEEWH